MRKEKAAIVCRENTENILLYLPIFAMDSIGLSFAQNIRIPLALCLLCFGLCHDIYVKQNVKIKKELPRF